MASGPGNQYDVNLDPLPQHPEAELGKISFFKRCGLELWLQISQ